MLSRYVRVVHNDNGTLTDKSLVSQDRTTAFSLPIITGEDYLYIGQYYPFNNLHFTIDTANSNASNIQIEVWNNEWVDAVDVLDGTSLSGASMAQSGIVQWDIDKDNSGWTQLDDPTNEGSGLGFNTLKIYHMYWIRVSFSADLSAGSDLKQISYKFCSDNDIKAKAPDVNDYLTSWEDGKTNWNDQIIEASKELVDYLKTNGLIRHAGDILRFDEVNTACVYKTLEIIYSGIGGEDYINLGKEAYGKFLRSIKNMPLVLDRDKNASVDPTTEVNKYYFGRLVR